MYGNASLCLVDRVEFWQGLTHKNITVCNMVQGDICLKFHLISKNDNFECSLVVVYGAAQDDHKGEFLAELVRFCEHEILPLLV